MRDADSGEIRRWFGTCTDIQDTVAARELLARSREDLEQLVAERTKDLHDTQLRLAQAQRMEALGQLAGGIAHDFNNVLQAVQGAAALLARRPTDAAYVHRHSQMILEVAERGAAITRRLLAFSRRGDLRAEPVDPAVLQTSIRDILAHTLGDGVKVAIELARDLPWLLADEGQLETVLINLATNARDAMSGIGTLTLAASAESISPDQARQHPGRLASGSYVRLSVSDTGVGMDAKTLSRASEPFFTTKPVGQGTGLGLAMARGFAEQSGGGLHIESEPGRGTIVSLWFPVADSAGSAVVAPARDVVPAVATGRTVRLLLVDDDHLVRDVTAELMQATGFEVLAADGAAAALELLESGAHVDVPDLGSLNARHGWHHVDPRGAASPARPARDPADRLRHQRRGDRCRRRTERRLLAAAQAGTGKTTRRARDRTSGARIGIRLVRHWPELAEQLSMKSAATSKAVSLRVATTGRRRPTRPG